MGPMRRIAFFGGSFDPPHRGHLAVARAAADKFALDQVLFAPVGRQPLKAGEIATPFMHRYAMTALATATDERFVPSLLDMPHDQDANIRPNYTVETLMKLRASLAAGSAPFALFTLVGADSWLNISCWHRAQELLALSDWIVAARPGFSLAQAEDALPPQVTATRLSGEEEIYLALTHVDGTITRVRFLPSLQEDISATELRFAFNKDAISETALPANVAEYVRKTNLYR